MKILHKKFFKIRLHSRIFCFREDLLHEWLPWIVTYSSNDNKIPMIELLFRLTIGGVLVYQIEHTRNEINFLSIITLFSPRIY